MSLGIILVLVFSANFRTLSHCTTYLQTLNSNLHLASSSSSLLKTLWKHVIINPCPQSSLRKPPNYCSATTVFLQNDQFSTTQQHSNQGHLGSDASSVWNLFARFFMRHFAGKSVRVGSQNVGCFLSITCFLWISILRRDFFKSQRVSAYRRTACNK